MGASPSGIYDEATLWWRHENLHREILRDYSNRIKEVASGSAALETEFLAETIKICQQSIESRKAFTQQCFSKAEQKELSWLEKISHMPILQNRPPLDKFAWDKFDKRAARTH